MDDFPIDATGDALRRFEENGFDMSEPMEIDFFVAVPTEDSGNLVADAVRGLGFAVSVEQDDETKDWTCYCTKTLVPAYALVVSIEKELTKVAQPYGGHCNGFGSFGNS